MGAVVLADSFADMGMPFDAMNQALIGYTPSAEIGATSVDVEAVLLGGTPEALLLGVTFEATVGGVTYQSVLLGATNEAVVNAGALEAILRK